MKRKSKRTLLIIIGALTMLFVLLTANEIRIKNQQTSPTPTLLKTTPIPTPKLTNVPSPTVVTTTQPQTITTPIPTTPVYKYFLWKSTDEIHLTVPTKTGFAISATLRDEKMNIVTNQSDFTYTWSIDNPALVHEKFQSFSGCTQGIQEPCPQDHFTFAATGSGQTVIRVKVNKGADVVAATTFPLIVEEQK